MKENEFEQLDRKIKTNAIGNLHGLNILEFDDTTYHRGLWNDGAGIGYHEYHRHTPPMNVFYIV